MHPRPDGAVRVQKLRCFPECLGFFVSCPRMVQAKRAVRGGRGQDTKNVLDETAARRAVMGVDAVSRELANEVAPGRHRGT